MQYMSLVYLIKFFLYMFMPADLHVMPINYSVHFGVSEYMNSNAIIKMNQATCNYFGCKYVNIMARVLQYLIHIKFTLSAYVFM